MEKFRYLHHTADAKFQAFGKSLEEAFSHAALAMVSLMWDPAKIEAGIECELKVSGRDKEQLLFNFLEDILFRLDSSSFLINSIKRIRIARDKNRLWLAAVLVGDTYSDKYETFGEVKAITYNEMKIKKNHSFMVQAVVDM